MICDCPEPFKHKRGKGRDSSRGALRGGRDRRGRRGYKANVVGTEKEFFEAKETSSVELEESKQQDGNDRYLPPILRGSVGL